MTETLTLADALTAASACLVQARASLPRLEPTDTTFPAAWTASFPCSWIALMSAGKFFVIVFCSAVKDDPALAPQSRVTLGGVHLALAFTWLWHCAWQLALALHDGGLTAPVHDGAVYATEHPPWQLPEQLMPALPGVAVQPPVQPPLQTPAQ
jgi:hypothetical protein